MGGFGLGTYVVAEEIPSGGEREEEKGLER